MANPSSAFVPLINQYSQHTHTFTHTPCPSEQAGQITRLEKDHRPKLVNNINYNWPTAQLLLLHYNAFLGLEFKLTHEFH